MEKMMIKTKIYSGIILALVLLYSGPVSAGDKSFGAQGMFSAGDMKTSIKSGGTFSSRSSVISGGTQVRNGGDERSLSVPNTNTNTINQLNAKGYSFSPGGTVSLPGTTNAVAQSAVVAVSGAEDTSHGYADPFIPETSAEAQANIMGNVASSSSDGLTLFRQDQNVQTGSSEDAVVVSRNRSVNRVITRGNEKKKRTSVDDPLDLSP